MPLLGKKLFEPRSPPKDLESDEEVFVIQETSEVFRSYDEYVNRVILYGFQVWTCHLTGKTNLKYGEAVESEKQAFKRLEGFPRCLERPLLQLVHHSTSKIPSLAQQCSKQLKNEYVEEELVKFYMREKWLSGRISKVYSPNNSELVSEDIPDSSSSPSSDKENAVDEPTLLKAAGTNYDVICEDTEESYKEIPAGNIKRLKPLPSVELLQCFIRANTVNAWQSDGSPLIVKRELVKKYSLEDKFSDFSFVLGKKSTPVKLTAKPEKMLANQNKRSLDGGSDQSKLKMKKSNSSQMRLDSFRTPGNNLKEQSTLMVSKSSSVKEKQSSSKGSSGELLNRSSSKDVDNLNSSRSYDERTPCKKLLGTPVKCKLLLTPVKSPRSGSSKKTALEKNFSKCQENSNLRRKIDATDSDCVISVKSSKMSPESSKTKKAGPTRGKDTLKLLSSSKRDPSKKKMKSTELQLYLASLGKDKVEFNNIPQESADRTSRKKSQETPFKSKVVITSVKSPKRGIFQAAEESDAKSEIKPTSFDDSDCIIVEMTEKYPISRKDCDMEQRDESKPKVEVQTTPITAKQLPGKLKQTTLLDLTKKSVDVFGFPFPSKFKAKKQQTLSDMFNAATQNGKPHTFNSSVQETTPVTSFACSVNLTTPRQQQGLDAALVWDKIREHHKWKLQQHQNRDRRIKSFEKVELHLKPLPQPKPVDLPSEIAPELFGDIVMITEFIHAFWDLLGPKKSLNITAESVIHALVSDSHGFSLVSHILVIFLQILLQDRSTKGQELGMQLSEMPLTQQTAPEVARLFLKSKANLLTADEAKGTQRIVDALQEKEFFSLPPAEKLTILVILCHEVMSSGALDDYIETQLSEASQLRKQKKTKEIARKEKLRAEKEQKKKEKEELMKKFLAEKGTNMQLKVDAPANNGEAENKLGTTVSESKRLDTSNQVQKMKQEVDKENGQTAQKEAQPVVRRPLRSQGPLKEDKTLEGEKRNAKLEEEDEKQWNINMAHCQDSLRLKPIGYDRHHARYWVFSGAAAGLFVEQGWNTFTESDDKGEQQCVQDEGKDKKELPKEPDSKMEQVKENDIVDAEMTATKENENAVPVVEEDGARIGRSVTKVSCKWSCYNTVESIEELLKCLSSHSQQESLLKRSLTEKMESIAAAINKRNSSSKSSVQETNGVQFLSALKEEMTDLAVDLVNGHLAVFSTTLEEYQNAVEQATTIRDLTVQLEKVLPGVLPQFLQGVFSQDKKDSETAKQLWMQEVKAAFTVSRVHLLLAVLDSTVIWNLSAENKPCNVCRKKGVGTTLILCDDCNMGYHLHCLRPALSEVPEGHWSCPVCKPNDRATSRSSNKNYKEMSSSDSEDQEIEDEEYSEEEDSEESDGHDDDCYTCGENGNLICCDTCPLVFHKDCHQPPLRIIPRGPWNCWMCRQPKNKKGKSKGEGRKDASDKKGTCKAQTVETNGSKRKRSSSSSPEPIETSPNDDSTPRDRRRRARDLSDSSANTSKSRRTRRRSVTNSDDDSDDGAPKTRQRTEKQDDLKDNRPVSRRLRSRERGAKEVEKANGKAQSNVKSFYGRARKRDVNPTIAPDQSEGESFLESSPDCVVGRKKSRLGKCQILDGSEDQYEEEDGAKNHRKSKRKIKPAKKLRRTVRTTTRNVRAILSSSDESESEDRDDVQSGNRRNLRSRGKQVSCSFDESEESGHSSTRKTTRKKQSSKKRNQKAEKSSTKTNRQRNHDTEKDAMSGAGDDMNAKKRRANVEMDACKQILRELLLHDDSWPFRQPVNLKEVPDYLKFVTAPMDLGTIKEKLENLEYPDVMTFVTDLRLVFDNCEKYNAASSDVGKAGITLETHFKGRVIQHFPFLAKKMKMQRKR